MNFLAMHNLNTNLFLFVQKLTMVSPFWDSFFLILTTTMSFILVGLILGYVAFHGHKKNAAVAQGFIKRHEEIIVVGTSVVLTYAIVVGLKFLIALPRPFLVLTHIETLLIYGGNNSFPSNHAAVFASLATSIYRYHKTFSYVLALLALLIGFSRVYVGVHYPLDVFAGLLIGIVVSFAVRRIYKYLRRSY